MRVGASILAAEIPQGPSFHYGAPIRRAITLTQDQICLRQIWCRERDLNPHEAKLQRILSPSRIPNSAIPAINYFQQKS